MVRRRSMALSAAGMGGPESTAIGGQCGEKNGSRTWSDAPESYYASGARRGSMAKGVNMGDEERLEAELAMAKRNSRDQEIAVRRSS